MTNELEKQFFETFGIEPFIYCSKPRLDCDARNKGSCRKDCEYYGGAKYPQITDSHYLELIILVNSPYYEIEYVYTDVQDLKVSILEQAIKCYKNDKLFTKHVQALFEEG